MTTTKDNSLWFLLLLFFFYNFRDEDEGEAKKGFLGCASDVRLGLLRPFWTFFHNVPK